MDLLNVIRGVNPSFVDGPRLTAAEEDTLQCLATPAATLLGAVGMVLRTSLFNDPTTAWIDVWQTRSHVARMEWMNGPEMPIVAARLASKEIEANVSGIPGLRLVSCDAYSARLTWYGLTEPVDLNLTRLVGTSEYPTELLSKMVS